MPANQQRARPLPANDRRRAILEAVTPLLIEKGLAVTSREMAEAAGVAEGTIFRVFPDKPSILGGAVAMTLDPEPVRSALAAIPADACIVDQLTEAARVLVDRSNRLAALVTAVRATDGKGRHHHEHMKRYLVESSNAILTALTELFARHAGNLSVPPDRAALAFRGLVYVNAHPMISADQRLEPAEFVEVILHGIAVSDTVTSTC